MQGMTNDALFIIKQFGGAKALAEAINKDPATVYRWTYPKNKGGTGGIIPSSSVSKVHDAAQSLNISISSPPAISEQSLSESAKPEQFINWFRNTAPYIHAHRDKTFVINISGEAVEDTLFSTLIEDFTLLNSLGIRLILVHGIRPQLERKLIKEQHASRVYQHLRVTDKTTLELAKETSGTVRTDIEAKLSTSLANTPMAGAAIRVASGNFVTAKPLGIINGVGYQFT